MEDPLKRLADFYREYWIAKNDVARGPVGYVMKHSGGKGVNPGHVQQYDEGWNDGVSEESSDPLYIEKRLVNEPPAYQRGYRDGHATALAFHGNTRLGEPKPTTEPEVKMVPHHLHANGESMGLPVNTLEAVKNALAVIERFGTTDGANQKAWVLDQVVRRLTGDNYETWRRLQMDGENGPNTYTWDEGTAP